MSRWSCAVVLALVSCGSEAATVEPAEFAELCGVAGPHRLVALAPDEALFKIHPFAGRLIYGTATRTGDTYEDHVLWSSGMCGESPRRIADDVKYTYENARWPGVLLGCRAEADDIVSLDPSGVEPPHVMFAGSGCFVKETAHGYLSLTGEAGQPGALTLHLYPDDPRSGTAQSIVLLDATSTPEHPISRRSRLRLTDDHAFILADDGELLRIELADRTVTVEQTGLRNFEISADGRYLLTQSLELTSEGVLSEKGTVSLHDRTSGFGVSLAQTSLDYGPPALAWVDLGLVPLVLGNGMLRVHFLPALDFVDTLRNVYFHGQIPDGRWLLKGVDSRFYLTDSPRVEYVTHVSDGKAHLAGDAITDDGVTLMSLTSCCSDPDEGPLMFVPFDRSERRLLAERASRFRLSLADGRLITLLDIDEQSLGDLYLVERETRTERLIDRRAIRFFRTFPELGDDILLYGVDDGERTGMWVVRPAPE